MATEVLFETTRRDPDTKNNLMEVNVCCVSGVLGLFTQIDFRYISFIASLVIIIFEE